MNKRIQSLVLLLIFSFQIFSPTLTYALTDGPSQPEASGFSPVGNSDMVNLFTGDFSYNVPLMDVGGYPINLAYQSGIGMEQEASWVGLGWSINPGSITRNLRGLPDDYQGDIVKKDYNIKENWTVGIEANSGMEVFGYGIRAQASAGIFYNSYKGFGLTTGIGATKGCGNLGNSAMTAGLGLSLNTQEGADINPSMTFNKVESNTSGDLTTNTTTTKTTTTVIGGNFSTRSGLKGLNFSRTRLTETTKREENKDNENSSKTRTLSSSLSFANPIYSPAIQMPMLSQSYSLKVYIGADAFATNPHGSIRGYYNKTKPLKTHEEVPAYGYFYEHKKGNSDKILLDMSREKDGTISQGQRTLPIPIHTFDLYNLSGEGVSGQFRAFRSDVGILNDQQNTSGSISGSGGVEIAPIGNLFKAGVNVSGSLSVSKARKWDDNNNLKNNTDFYGSNSQLQSYEPAYFKLVGEQTIPDNAYNTKLFNDDIVQPSIYGDVLLSEARGTLIRYNHNLNQIGESVINSNVQRNERDIRGTNISYLTVEEKERSGESHMLKNFPANVFDDFIVSPSPTSHWHPVPLYNRPHHHIAEITVTKPDGKRYNYGIPIYNNTQKDLSFSVSSTATKVNGIVTYASSGPSPDNSTSNTKGLDNFYSAQTNPQYPHSYLLTSVVSADYVDRLQDGPTNDDPGTWVKFNYTRVSSDYKWRMPFQANSATFNEGFKTDPNDDKGSYIYGSKEIWVLHSIESRNFIALFTTDADRKDGLGVLGENGGLDPNQKQVLLSKITLYSKSDLYQNGLTNAVPIKCVHFIYNYELCQNILNSSSTASNDKGKLTLKGIYFTYGNSSRGQFSKYLFEYDSNPDYNSVAVDRWGNYKREDSPYNPTDPVTSLKLSNSYFPYTSNNKTESDLSASAWNLSKISLPSGGTIDINYESDDYAFTQDQRACEMVKLIKVGPNSNINDPNAGNDLYKNAAHPNNFWFFDVPFPVNTKDEIKARYIGDLTKLYFKVFTKIKGSNSEFISGYADIADYGIVPGNPNIMWVKVASEKAKTFWTSPVTKLGFQMLRNDLQFLTSPSAINPNFDLAKLVKSLLGVVAEIKNLIIGFDQNAVSHDWAKSFTAGQFWVKLCSPELKRLGGGSRVKTLKMSDNWSDATDNSESSSYYLTKYQYTTVEMINNIPTEISSGVASYEPAMGGDENIFHKAFKVNDNSAPLSPKDNKYFEEPLGESYFPAPSVGYSKVKTISVDPSNPNTALKSGYHISEYYTAKDYPTIAQRTQVTPYNFHPGPLASFVSFFSTDLMTATQGYYVELNDMHGKPKSEKEYNSTGSLISGKNYKYKDGLNSLGQKHLVNDVQVIDEKGVMTNSQIGVETDLTIDMRENNTKSVSGGGQFNIDAFTIPFVPPIAAVPSGYPDIFLEYVRLRTAVTAKIINKSAILDYVETFRDGANVRETNIAYDKQSGQVIIKNQTDEFGRNIFDISQPAYWKNTNMGPSYVNTGMTIEIQPGSPMMTITGTTKTYLNNGDELLPATALDEQNINNYYMASGRTTSNNRFWVSYPEDCIYPAATSPMIVLDDDGEPLTITKPLKFKVVNSGRKNQPNESMAHFVATPKYTNINTPFVTSGSQTKLSFNNLDIIDMNAKEYYDNWKLESKNLSFKSCDTIELSNWPCFETFVNGLLKMVKTNYTNANILYTIPNTPLTVGQIIDFYGGTPCSNRMLGNYSVDNIYFLPSNPNVNYTTKYYANLGPDCFISITWNNPSGSLFPLDELKQNNGTFHDPSNDPQCLSINRIINNNTIRDWTICLHGKSCAIECKSLETVNGTGIYNPFVQGNANNWHQRREYTYNEKRTIDGNSLAKNSGVYSSYNLPYLFNSGLQEWESNFQNDQRWVMTNFVTKINRIGTDVENKNALELSSSALFGYNYEIPIAISKNSKYNELYFTGYEDQNYATNKNQCFQNRWFIENIPLNSGYEIVDNQAHTGKHSIKINNNGSVEFRAKPETETNDGCNAWVNSTIWAYKYTSSTVQSLISPEVGKTYVLNAWVHKNGPCDGTDFGTDIGNVWFATASPGIPQTFPFEPKSNIIDGWQLYQVKVVVPIGYTSMEVIFGGSNEIYIDDFRMAPLKSDTKCYVYHPYTLKLMAILDANHFATFYEYDEEGNLIRTKKETERGILTLSENRKNIVKKN